MSTRAIARIYDDDGETILTTLYKHYDGYPEGFGRELEDFASEFTLVNGIPVGDTRKLANGMGCFAASLFSHFKNEVGDVYVYPAKAEPMDVEYIYYVKPSGESITVTVKEL